VNAPVETSVDELTLLRAETATLRQLLTVLEQTAIDQTTRLQQAVRERTKIADELRQQVEFSRALTQSMGDGVIAVDTAGKVSFVNRAAAEMMGQPASALAGRPIPDVTVSASRIADVLEKRSVIREDDDAIRRPDDTTIPVATTISPMAAGDDLLGAIVVFRDVSARKDAEKQRMLLLETERAARIEAERTREVARFLAEAGSVLVGSIDYTRTLEAIARLSIPSFADWSFVHILEEDDVLRRVAVAHSDPAREVLLAQIEEAYPPTAEDPIGPARVARTGQPELFTDLTDEVLVAAAKNRDHLEKIRQFGLTSYLSVPLVARGQKLGSLSFAYAESGRRYTADDLLTARQLADRAALALENSRLFSDLQEARRNLERRVEQRTAQLQEANRELESFSYSVSHDLRAPIRHINGFVDMLAKRVGASLDPTAAHYVTAISTSAKYAGNLVDDLLAFSRMSRAGMVRAHIKMNQLVDQARNDLAPDMSGRKIEWEVGELGEVTGDASMLRLVWRNLIGNAVKYSKNRDVTRIAIGAQKDAGEIRYFVRDNGVGFDMQYGEKLFGVFQRLHAGDQFEGTGIGLANVKRIVTRHGGRVWAEGEIDRGATFWFALPAEHSEESIE
jgi:PAS domain S-box-containing protein